MNLRPLISVIIPTYNRDSVLREAVESVFAQTYDHWELLVVDDGSTDATREYLKAFTDPRVRPVLLDHVGNAAHARNVGVRAARGSHIGFLDSDDLWHPEKLTLQVEELETHPECRWGYTGIALIDERGREIHPVDARLRPAHRGWVLEQVLVGRALVTTSTVIVERDLFEAAGGFDESMVRCHDIDLWIRLAEASPAGVVSMPLASWRQHPGNRHAFLWDAFGNRIRTHDGFFARTRSARLRRLCRRQRIRVTLDFVRTFRAIGRYPEARRALRISLRYAGWHPGWWTALLRTWLHPFIPGRLLSLYSRLRTRRRRNTTLPDPSQGSASTPSDE